MSNNIMGRKSLGCRVVLFPSPFEGHLNPMLNLATLFYTKGFSITIIHTTLFNSPNKAKFPQFHFVPLLQEDELSSGEDHMRFLIALNASFEDSFRLRMGEILNGACPGEEPIACLIVDAQLYFTAEVAEELKLPRLVLRTSSASSLNLFAALPLLNKIGLFPIQDEEKCCGETLLPNNMSPMRVKDLPHFRKSTASSVYEVITKMVESIRSASGLIMNTFQTLEAKELHQLQTNLNLPIFPIGPLHKLMIPPNNNNNSNCCMDWLDKQANDSVLYVSFGSLACMDWNEVLETAWGLGHSNKPFLWVIRSGSVRGLDGDHVLDELAWQFGEETKKRGRVLRWAPQQEVLRHPAVGGFWTHCGWNSVLESVCEGVPMICWPSFGDQLGNARVVSRVWKVGIQMEGVLEREEVGRVVRRLMVGEEGEIMRERIKHMKENARRCVAFHATSQLDGLVEQILTFN